MKLSDRSVWNHIFPVTSLKKINNIFIIRDTPGPDINKVKYISSGYRGGVWAALTVPIKLIRLLHLSLTKKPFLIHSYLLFPHGYLAFIAGKLTGKKVGVSLLAGPVEVYIFGGSPINKYKYCQPLPQLNIINKIVIHILKNFDVITVSGTYTKDFLIRNGVDNKKIFMLPHVVDERFRPLNIQKDYDIIFVGRLAPVKHIETLIQATEQIKKALPSIHVAIVGDGEERDKLEKLTRDLGLTEQIDFVGYQTNTWDWYNRSRLSVVTSEREGFPYTVIESLKCGVPVVTSNCGDVCDIVEDAFNGFIILSDYQDYNGFSEAILKLLLHPEHLADYSVNALHSIEFLSSSLVAAVWKKIISSVAEEVDNIE
jgi:glycosyltransferase involved in cell wall biosynthesis